jgi:hypothetical protein
VVATAGGDGRGAGRVRDRIDPHRERWRGHHAGQAARLIAQGAREANAHLAESGWPLVNHLLLVELYLDRASDVWRALQVQAAAAPAKYDVTEFVKPGPGALPRMLDSGYRGADYDLISAISDKDKDGEPCISYTLDTQACPQRSARAADAEPVAAAARERRVE